MGEWVKGSLIRGYVGLLLGIPSLFRYEEPRSLYQSFIWGVPHSREVKLMWELLHGAPKLASHKPSTHPRPYQLEALKHLHRTIESQCLATHQMASCYPGYYGLIADSRALHWHTSLCYCRFWLVRSFERSQILPPHARTSSQVARDNGQEHGNYYIMIHIYSIMAKQTENTIEFKGRQTYRKRIP